MADSLRLPPEQIPRICATCEHFRLDAGHSSFPGYSSWTPGYPSEPMTIFCKKGHWRVEGHDETEASYRAKQLSALTCEDYELVAEE